MTQVLSADWVLPVAGAPIERGAVAFEGGRIAAVGSASELGEGERFADSVIVPGLVNAHTHLEYAVYAGFGDGQPFGPWLRTHIERKARIGVEEFLAIARLGAAECLRSGVMTITDASFSGMAAVAASHSPAGRHSNSLPLGPQGRSISRTRSGRSARGSAPTSPSSRSPGRRTCPGRTPPRRSFSGGRPTEFYSPSSTARSATGKEGSDGTSFVAAQAPHAHACSTEKRQAQAPSQ